MHLDIDRTFLVVFNAKVWKCIDKDIRYIVREFVWWRADGRVWWHVGRQEVDQLKEDYHE